MTRILILGGTKDARLLAQLCAGEFEVITSLAGRTKSPQAIAGSVRVGGFGGAEGLANYIRDEGISVVIDATHPFAATISDHAAQATEVAGIARAMIERASWVVPAGLQITRVSSMEAIVPALEELACRYAFITTGTRGLEIFRELSDIQFLIRQIENHEGPAPFDHANIIVQKPPFDLAQERETMASHNIDVLITKESGGSATESKLLAAAELGIQVIMIERPPMPGGEKVSSPEGALGWIRGLPSPGKIP